mgnify:CR=1 FL=1
MAADRAEFNDWLEWENFEFTSDSVIAIVDYEINTGSGTETDTKKFLGKEGLGTGIVLRPSATVTIPQIDNKVFRTPITVTTAGLNVSKHMKDFNKIIIRTTTTSTIIRLLVT